MSRSSWVMAALAFVLCACFGDADPECEVRGVVVDVQDGSPLVGVWVEGPGGKRAVSDPRGRFALAGLEEGVTGRLRAWRSDGWEVEIPLRPLQTGSLEVVLRLAPK